MTNVMETRLGRKWWFAGLLGFLSALLTLPLLQAAGLRSLDNWAQWLVHFLCFGAIWRGLGFAGVEDASAAGGEAKSGTAQPALQRRMRFGSGLRHFNGQNAPPDPVKSRGIQQSSCQSRKSPGF